MPPSLALSVERNGRLMWILRYAVLTGYVLYGMRLLTIQRGTPIRSSLWGLAVGIALILFRYFALPRLIGIGFENPDHSATRGPIAVWTIIIILGGCSEELWRALCLHLLRRDGMTTVNAILLIAAVFTLSELGGRPSLISSRRDELYFTFVVGICFGEMLVKFHSLSMIVSGNIAYHSLAFYFMRRLAMNRSGSDEVKVLGPTPGRVGPGSLTPSPSQNRA